MKRNLLALFLALALCLALAACGGEDAPPAADGSPAPSGSVPDVPPMDEPSGPQYELGYVGNRLYTSSIGTVWSQTIIEVVNTGDVNLYLGSAGYDLEDESGALVAAKSYVSAYPDVLTPGETGLVYDDTIIDNVTADMALTVIPHVDVEAATVEKFSLPISDFSLSMDRYNRLSALGRVENNTGADLENKMIYIVAALYDSEGKPLGLMMNILMDPIKAGEKIGFELSGGALPGDVTPEAVAEYVLYAYPSQMQF